MDIYNIGQKIWVAHIEYKKSLITCPVCNGNKVVTVIYGDGTQVEVECGFCDNTFPYTWKASGVVHGESYLVTTCEPHIITGVDIRTDNEETRITYWIGNIGARPENVGLTREEAIAKAEARTLELAKEREKKEKDEKHWNAKSYTRNAQYFLERAAQARKDVEFYERKVRVMQEKARPHKSKKEK